ncbi:uncharacterized protein Fot_05603 [Forsythia ovata]|uniref:Uncharacterized protein n=1 Tax=Forsythia ovata TaxID=205694 RepID=A0ABD1WQK9_9LAMI
MGESSKRSLRDEDKLEVLDEWMLSKNAIKPRTARTSEVNVEALGLLPTHLQKATTTIESFWTEGWAAYSKKSSTEDKLNAAKTLTARSIVLIEEAEASVSDLELNKRNVATALQNAESIMKDWDHYKERVTWLQEGLNEVNKELRPLTDEMDKLKKDLDAVEFDVVKFFKRCDLDYQAEEIKGENLSLKLGTEKAVKAGMEDFKSHFEFTPVYENLQTFFVNFGDWQVFTEVKELYPNLDLSAIEVDYPTPEEAEDGVDSTPDDGADHPLVDGA